MAGPAPAPTATPAMADPRPGFEEIRLDAATAARLRDHPHGRVYLADEHGRRLGLFRTSADIESYRRLQERFPITEAERALGRTDLPAGESFTLDEVLAAAERAGSLRKAS